MRTDYNKEQQYVLAKKRVEKLGKFYKHLSVYIAVNVFLSAIFIYNDINAGDSFEEAFFNLGNYKIWFWWGIGILFQALNTFGLPFLLGKNWEQRKLQQYLKEEENRR